MAKQKVSFDSFEKIRRREGTYHHSYARDISRAATAKKDARAGMLILDALICVLLPPLGIYRLFTSSEHTPLSRAILTLVAAAVMLIVFTSILPEETPTPVSVSVSAPKEVTVYSVSD